MGKPDWNKIAELMDVCSKHQKKHKVDPILWGDCFNCPVEDLCPNFTDPTEEDTEADTNKKTGAA